MQANLSRMTELHHDLLRLSSNEIPSINDYLKYDAIPEYSILTYQGQEMSSVLIIMLIFLHG